MDFRKRWTALSLSGLDGASQEGQTSRFKAVGICASIGISVPRGRSVRGGEGGQSMKTILVPTGSHEQMRAALSAALMLARQFDSYIEGFALRFRVNEFIAVDMAGAIPLETLREESVDEGRRARALFEGFMEEHAVPRSDAATASLSYGWCEDAPE